MGDKREQQTGAQARYPKRDRAAVIIVLPDEAGAPSCGGIFGVVGRGAGGHSLSTFRTDRPRATTSADEAHCQRRSWRSMRALPKVQVMPTEATVARAPKLPPKICSRVSSLFSAGALMSWLR